MCSCKDELGRKKWKDEIVQGWKGRKKCKEELGRKSMLKDDVEGTENGRMSFYSLQFFRYVWLSFGWSASKFLPLHYNLNPLSRLSYRYPDIRQQSPICEAGCLHLPQWRVRYGSRHRWIQRRSLVFIWKPKKKTHLNKIKNATRFFYRPQSL